jgi:hypothetical protein
MVTPEGRNFNLGESPFPEAVPDFQSSLPAGVEPVSTDLIRGYGVGESVERTLPDRVEVEKTAGLPTEASPPQVRLSKRFTPGHNRFPKGLMPDTAVTNQLPSEYPLIAGPAYDEATPGILAPQPPESFEFPPQSLN